MTGTKLLILTSALVVGLAVSLTLFIGKKEPAAVRVNVKDFPEHGISLVGPSDPSFASLKTKLTKSKSDSISEVYSVFLKNTGRRTVVGYRIKWECVNGSGEVSVRDSSNIISWIFLHGEESDHAKALGRTKEVIRPNSIWLIPFDATARPVGGDDDVSFDAPEIGGRIETEAEEPCRSVTVIADGIFFDDGTFIGPDTTDFLTVVKAQMDARRELLSEIRADLEAGKKAEEVFRGLEAIRDQKPVELGQSPSADEFHAYFRRLFAQDVLGRRELWGAAKALEDVRLQLSRPWVELRKL